MSKLDEIRRDLRTIHQHQSESAAEQMADTLVEHVAFLLAEVDRLTEACPFGLEGHVLCDCATHVQQQVQRVEALAEEMAGQHGQCWNSITARRIRTALRGEQ